MNRSFATLSRLLWQGQPTASVTASISSTCLTFARCTIADDTKIVRFSCQSCSFNARSERRDAVGKSRFRQPPRNTSSLKDRVSAPSRFRLEWPERCLTPGRGAIDRATSGDAAELRRSMRKSIRDTLQDMKNEIIRWLHQSQSPNRFRCRKYGAKFSGPAIKCSNRYMFNLNEVSEAIHPYMQCGDLDERRWELPVRVYGGNGWAAQPDHDV